MYTVDDLHCRGGEGPACQPYISRSSWSLKGQKKFSTQLFENVNPPGHYKEIMGVNNKFPDFTLWRRSNSNLHVWINRNNKSSNSALWHGKPLGSQHATCAMGQLAWVPMQAPPHLPTRLNLFFWTCRLINAWQFKINFPFALFCYKH